MKEMKKNNQIIFRFTADIPEILNLPVHYKQQHGWA